MHENRIRENRIIFISLFSIALRDAANCEGNQYLMSTDLGSRRSKAMENDVDWIHLTKLIEIIRWVCGTVES